MEHVYQTILVGIDGSEQSKEAFKKAVEIARRNQGRVVVTVVIEPQTSSGLGYAPLADNLVDLEEQEAKDLLQEAKDYAASVNFNLVEDIVSFGSAKVALAKDLQEKYQADLIIVGQSGLNAVERFITGSVASYIIREAKCDVLVVSTEKEAE